MVRVAPFLTHSVGLQRYAGEISRETESILSSPKYLKNSSVLLYSLLLFVASSILLRFIFVQAKCEMSEKCGCSLVIISFHQLQSFQPRTIQTALLLNLNQTV